MTDITIGTGLFHTSSYTRPERRCRRVIRPMVSGRAPARSGPSVLSRACRSHYNKCSRLSGQKRSPRRACSSRRSRFVKSLCSDGCQSSGRGCDSAASDAVNIFRVDGYWTSDRPSYWRRCFNGVWPTSRRPRRRGRGFSSSIAGTAGQSNAGFRTCSRVHGRPD